MNLSNDIPYRLVSSGNLSCGAAVVGYLFKGIELARAFAKDEINKTKRNVITTCITIAAGTAGGIAGLLIAKAASTIAPILATTAAPAVLAGVLGAAVACVASLVTNAVGDAVKWDMKKLECKACGHTYWVRVYEGEDQGCPECRKSK